MTTFAGSKETAYANVQIALDPYTSANLFLTRAYYTGDVLPANDFGPSIKSGARTLDYPDVTPTTFVGSRTSDFIADWYYRIHFIPASIDLGNLVSSQSRDVLLWNAYLTDKSMTGFSGTGLDGIAVIQPTALASLPAPMEALGLYTYELEIGTAGPPIIDGSLNWTIAGTSYDVPIVGRRVIAFAFPPNWDRGVQETLEGKSTVIAHQDGSEQRAKVRNKARRIFDYTTTVRATEAQRFESLVFGWHARLFALPVWPEQASLTAPVAAGGLVLACDTTNRSFVAGGLVAVFKDSATVEIREIESLTASSITLTSGVLADWPTGSKVYPAVVSALNQSLSGNRLTDNLIEIPVRFTAEPSTTPTNASGAAAATYEGAELYLERPNWAAGLEFQWESDYVMQDAGTNKFSLLGRSGFSQFSRGHSWTLKGLGEVAAYRGWLARRGGRALPVYMPSDTDDFILTETVASSDTAIDCKQNDYENQAGAHPARRDILIQFRDGTYLARRISSATTGENGVTRLVFTASLGRNFAPADVKRISFLGLYRMGSDATTITWLTRGVATVQATMVNTTT